MHVPFELEMPTDLAGALSALAAGRDAKTVPIAGGTNLIVDMRAKRERPDRVVGLGKVGELRGMDFSVDRISIGGGTTVTDLLESAEIAESAPSLVDSARLFAGLMVRNTATVAGNIACGSPAADLVPPLLSLDADVTLASVAGTRTLPLDEYFLDYKRDVRRPDELITRISWARLPASSVNTFYKLARRKGDAITVTGVALTLCVAGGGLHDGAHRARSRRAVRVPRPQRRSGAGGPGADPGADRRGRGAGRRRIEPHRRRARIGRVPPPYRGGADPADGGASLEPARLTDEALPCTDEP